MLILVTLNVARSLWRVIVEEVGIYFGRVPENKLDDDTIKSATALLRARVRELGNIPVVYGRYWSAMEENVRGPGLTYSEARAFARLAEANSGSPMPAHCFRHTEREPTFVVTETTLYLCNDCAEEQRELGAIVRPLRGVSGGLPVLDADDDGILDCRIIDD